MTFVGSCGGLGAATKSPVTSTVREPAAEIPFNSALITAVPTLTAVTTPVSLTVATSVSEEVKVK